ncbi:hypothetical protein ISS04_02195 [Candidatus Woesearchaeota archaeon]|nr:hypothetical protein [Candidatus Woesearchaeota archaeon]
MKIKKIIFGGCMILLIFLLAGTIFAWQLIPHSGTPKTNWYDVEDWEVDVCSRGVDVPEIQSSPDSGDSSYVYDFTFTLNAQETELYNVSLYEVSYYIEPMDGNITFQVFLLGPGISTNVTGEMISKPNGGKAGYEFIEYEKGVYTEAQIDYWGHASGSYTVPVVKNEE